MPRLRAILVLGITGVALWFHGVGTTPALADFLQPILDAKTVTYKATSEGEGNTRVISKVMVMAPNWMRSEQEATLRTPQGPKPRPVASLPSKFRSVHIIVDDGQEDIVLIPDQKMAILTSYVNMPKPVGTGHKNIFLELRSQLVDARDRPDWICEPLGEKEIDGRRLVGYRLTGHGMVLDLWGDPQTRMPVRIEATAPSSPSTKPVIYSDFAFNVELDKSLFSLEPPPGYKLQKRTLDVSPAQENDLVETFRRYGQLRGGTLPDAT